MTWRPESSVVAWLSSAENPPVRYLTARDLARPRPSPVSLDGLRRPILTWQPLASILALQREDGSFAARSNPSDARRTFWALVLLQRCGLDVGDEPVARAVEHLHRRHGAAGAVSYTGSGSGVLPCYLGVVTTALVKLGALDTELVQGSITWLVDHQRFDHRSSRAGGGERWPYRAPQNYGCWQDVSCYHGVVGAFRAFAAIPAERRTPEVRQRLEEAIEYLRVHRLYKRSSADRPLFRHLTLPFLVGDYRSSLLDVLQGVADADPELVRQDWVRAAVDDMRGLTVDGRVVLATNYGKKLLDPIPLEPIGAPSRFLTYQWLLLERAFADADAATVSGGPSRTRAPG